MAVAEAHPSVEELAAFTLGTLDDASHASVEAHVAPRYHRLISEFEKRTSVPILLNTSFNENEPIVLQPAEALDCFLRTNMDVLVMGHHMLTKAAPDA